jgi:hydrogenase maturation protease
LNVEQSRILVAGIGNIFFGDDAFGVEVARLLLGAPLPPHVRVVDFGIRGLDLAYAMLENLDLVVLVDTVQRGQEPGTVYVLDLDWDDVLESNGQEPTSAHLLAPDRVLQMVKSMGGPRTKVRLVGCEPLTFGSDDDPALGLSAVVEVAVARAVDIIGSLLAEAA